MIRLTSQSESSGGEVRYYLAQHMADLFRKETRNVGVLVQRGDQIAARFLGEVAPGGELDKRAIHKARVDLKLYQMWVHYWRKALTKPEWEKELFDDSRKTFAFIPGGDVSNTETDSADAICDYLFHMLVSDGGLKEAMRGDEESEQDEVTPGDFDLSQEFREMGIMRTNADDSVRHPVVSRYSARGRGGVWHELTYAMIRQDEAWAIEPIRGAINKRKALRERAGYLGYIFRDLSEAADDATAKIHGSVVISMTAEEEKTEHVANALKMIRPYAEIVNLKSHSERKSFLSRAWNYAHAA